MDVQRISEVQIAAEKAWIIISTSIIVVLGVAAIAVLVWWVVENIKDMRREKNKDNSCNIEMLKHSSDTSAAAADAGWSSYIEMKRKFEKSEEDRQKEKYFSAQWDFKRVERIHQLEEQLRSNGIDPIPASSAEKEEDAA